MKLSAPALVLTPFLLLLGCQESVEQPILMRQCVLSVSLDVPNAKGAPVLVNQSTGDDELRYPLEPEGLSQWGISIPLPPGRSLYWLEVDGERLADPGNPLTQAFGGDIVSVAQMDDCAVPELQFVERTGPWNRTTLTLVMARARDGASLDRSSLSAESDGTPLATRAVGDHIYVSTSNLAPGKHRIDVNARDTAGRSAHPYQAPLWIERQSFRWDDAIIYQIMVDRFAGEVDLGPRARAKPPGYRAGGTLNGITRKIQSGYFEALGVSALWLSPLYQNPDGRWVGVEGGPPRYESYHGYWPIEPRALDSRLGSSEDLERLVEAAHARGVRVIVDVVPNHVHEEHVYRRTHPEWLSESGCVCGAPECPWWREIQTCWFTPYLPDVNWAAPGALQAFVGDMTWWIERFDLDGLRVDAVPMIPRFVTRHLAHEVHTRFEGAGTRHYLLGETFTGPEGHASIRYPLGAHGLDGQFDFPWMWALRSVFSWETAPMDHLASVWREGEAAWLGSASVMATMVGNHDVTRFASEAHAGGLPGGDPWRTPAVSPIGQRAHEKLRLAQAMVLTLPGAPVIYYGDEFGQAGGRDPDNRRPMRFGGELDERERATLDFTRRLGALRACMPALRTGALDFTHVGDEDISYRRSQSSQDWALIEIRRGAPSTPLDVATRVGDSWSGVAIDALSGERVRVEDGALSRTLVKPYTVRILLPEGHRCLPAP